MHRLVLLLPMLAAGRCGLAEECPNRQRMIRVAGETTKVTAPLDADGYVDYVAALNARYSKGVTPENNFDVVVRRVRGPELIDEQHREEYHRRLGIPALPVKAEYFVAYPGLDADAWARLDEDARNKVFLDQNRALNAPWTKTHLPFVAEWLDRVDGQLDQIVEGSKRPRNYTPYLTRTKYDDGFDSFEWQGPPMFMVGIPSAQQQRDIAYGLRMRAMYRLGSGDVDGAWSDALALHRMARHVASGATIIEVLVGSAVDDIACHVEAAVLRSPHLTTARAKQCLVDLGKLPPLPPMARTIDFGERLTALDAVQSVARSGEVTLRQIIRSMTLSNDLATADPLSVPSVQFVGLDDAKPEDEVITPDWNEALLETNRWYDRLVEIDRTKDVTRRRAEERRLLSDLTDLKKEVGDPVEFYAKQRRAARDPKAAGRAIGRMIVSLVLPATAPSKRAEDRAASWRAVTRLGFAAEVHRRETGRLPEKLDDLAPRYVAQVASDPLTGGAFVMKPTDAGLVIYGFGQNGEDDHGVTADDRPEGDEKSDDIAVRLLPRE